jgi:hypothetical protein
VALGTCPVGGSEFTAGSSTFVDLLKKQYGCLDSKCQGSGDVDLMQTFSYPDGNMGNVVMECFRCLSIFFAVEIDEFLLGSHSSHSLFVQVGRSEFKGLWAGLAGG